MSLLKDDSAYARLILSMQTAVLCYTQPLNNGIYVHHLWIHFENTPFFPRLYEFHLSIKDLEILE